MFKPKSILVFIVLALCWIGSSAQDIGSASLLKRKQVFTLIGQIQKAQNKDQWQNAVDSAQKAIAIDSATYSKYIDWMDMGISRQKLSGRY
jgi:hypothetical protein